MNSLKKLYRSIYPLQIFDFFYFHPNAYSTPKKVHAYGFKEEIEYRSKLPYRDTTSWMRYQHLLSELKNQYGGTLVLPKRFEKLGFSTKRSLVADYYQKNADPLFIINIFPYAGFGYMALRGGITEEIENTFGTIRLMEVKQLAYVHDGTWRKDISSLATSQRFNHTRGLHTSCDVPAIGNLIIRNNPCLRPFTTLAHVGFSTHDARTPALGDTTKGVNFAFYDEDAHYGELLTGEKWKNFQAKYSIDAELLIAMVQGKGVLGKVLDLADKIAYTIRDAWAYTSMLHISPPDSVKEKGTQMIYNILAAFPTLGNIWNDVRVTDGQVAFAYNPKIAWLYILRAHMFRYVYYYPASHFPERTIMQFFLKEMIEKQIIKREEPLVMTDSELEHKICAYAGIIPFMYPDNIQRMDPKIEFFDSLDEAQAALLAIQNQTNRVAYIETFSSKTKTGVDDLLILKDKKLILFKEAFPKEYEYISGLMRFEERHDVISFIRPLIPNKIQNLLTADM